MLSPIAPHITHVLWEKLGHKNILETPWPTVDNTALKTDTFAMVIQVNGKMRGQMMVPITIDEETLKANVLSHENVQRHVQGKTVRKIIIVPKKLINVVV